MAHSHEKVEVSAAFIRQTEKAFCITDGSKDTWVPKSQTTVDGELIEGKTYTWTMPEWLAKDKGLI